MATVIPDNGAAFSFAELASATGARVDARGRGGVAGVSTDSRKDLHGKLFVALVGETFDGHAFVTRAAEAGAAAVMVSRDVDVPSGCAVARVADTLDALGALGRAHRRRWGGRVVAVGGSAGKTTTRAAIAAVLEGGLPGAVHYAAGNLNNRIGVPMVLLGAGEHHRVAVLEIGTNVRGEVATLAAVAEPDIAVLTLIGLEHAAGIGSLDDVEQEEGDLLRALDPASTAVVNGDDDRVLRQLDATPAQSRIAYGERESADYRIVGRTPRGADGADLSIERPVSHRRDGRDGGNGREVVAVRTPLLGRPGALAAAAALAVGDRVIGAPVDGAMATRALAAATAREPGRLDPVELVDGTIVLDDSYNSNPASARASIEVARELAQARDARLVLVLGEMRELGDLSPAEHAALGADVAASGAAALVAVAGDARHIADGSRGVQSVFADDADHGLRHLLDVVQPTDVVLVKASRGVALERVVKGLVEARGRAA